MGSALKPQWEEIGSTWLLTLRNTNPPKRAQSTHPPKQSPLLALGIQIVNHVRTVQGYQERGPCRATKNQQEGNTSSETVRGNHDERGVLTGLGYQVPAGRHNTLRNSHTPMHWAFTFTLRGNHDGKGVHLQDVLAPCVAPNRSNKGLRCVVDVHH
jgi:hypothetical protein